MFPSGHLGMTHSVKATLTEPVTYRFAQTKYRTSMVLKTTPTNFNSIFRTLPILCFIDIVRMLFDKLSLQVKCRGAFCSFAHLVVFLGTMAGFKCWVSPTIVQIKFRNLVPPKLLDQWSWSLLKTGSLCSIDWLMCQQKSLKILVELHESVTERLCLRMSHKKTCSIFLAGRVRRNY